MSSSSTSALTGCSTCSRAALFLFSTSSRLSRSKCSRYLWGQGPRHPSQSCGHELPACADNFAKLLSKVVCLLSESALPQVPPSRSILTLLKPNSPAAPEGKLAARREPRHPSSTRFKPSSGQPASPPRSDFLVSREGPLSPIWVIASWAQTLGRLLVEPTDVMGHGLPV